MIRFLPIFLLAFGLILTFSSLARADMHNASIAPASDVVCLEMAEQGFVANTPERKSVMCWKKLKTGLIVLPCPPEPSLASAVFVVDQTPAGPSCLDSIPLHASAVEPPLNLPPPRA